MAAGSTSSPNKGGVPPARAGMVALTGGGWIPIGFVFWGLLAGTASSLWVASSPDLLLSPALLPRVVALVHAWLPGFLLSICFGAVYQLMPVVLGTDLAVRSGWLWGHLAIHAIGTLTLVAGFAHGDYPLAAMGGILVSLGVMIFMITCETTFSRSDRRDAVAWTFLLAGYWLFATVVFGTLLALNKRWSLIPLPATQLLSVHAHMGLIGFFLTLLQGSTFQLVPMFTMGQLQKPDSIRTGLMLSQTGLVLLVPAMAWNWKPLLVAGGLLLVLAIAFSGNAFLATLGSRKRKRLEPGIKGFVWGMLALAATAIIGGYAVQTQPDLANDPIIARVYFAMGVALALSLAILGMLCKILPFLVWMKAYGGRIGRQKVPLATELSSRQLEGSWMLLHTIGIMVCIFAIASSFQILATVGTIIFALGSLCYFANAIQIALHLIHPRTP